MEKLAESATADNNSTQYYPPHLKKVLKSYQKSAVKSLQGPSILDSDQTNENKKAESGEPSAYVCASPSPVPIRPAAQLPIFSVADQSAELSETLVEGQRISCFIIGGEKRVCFVQLLSTVLRNVNAATINNVCAELYINFSSCNSDQLLALKAKGILPPETPTCGLVTKPDAERLCSVLLHEGVLPPFNLDKYAPYSFMVYHECFSGAKGLLYYQLYSERNWCVQCVVCRRFFSPQMFVCHSCFLDKKRNTIHTYIETGICHWGFDASNWKLYLKVCEDQPDYEKCSKIMEFFVDQHKGSPNVITLPSKRKQVPGLPLEKASPNSVPIRVAAGTGRRTPAARAYRGPLEEDPADADDGDDGEKYHCTRKKARLHTVAMVTVKPPAPASASAASTSAGQTTPNFRNYYSNLRESWVKNSTYERTWSAQSLDSQQTTATLVAKPQPIYIVNPASSAFLGTTHLKEGTSLTRSSKSPPPLHKITRGVVIKDDVAGRKSPASSGTTISVIAKTRMSPPAPKASTSAAIVARPPSIPAIGINGEDNSVTDVMKQVASVLDVLTGVDETVRTRVLSLVKGLTMRIDESDSEKQHLQRDVLSLRSQLTHLRDENERLYYDNAVLRQQLDAEKTSRSSGSSPTAKAVPSCSPVSVITSPSPTTNVKSDSQAPT